MADQAIASSAEGGVIRQNAFGGTYRDPFAPNTNSRRRGGGGGRGRGRNQSFADPEVERRAREAEEAARREQERKETERIATEEKISSSQQLAGQLKQVTLPSGTGGTIKAVSTSPKVAFAQSVRNIFTPSTIGRRGFSAYFDDVFEPFRDVNVGSAPDRANLRGTEMRGTITSPVISYGALPQDLVSRRGLSPGDLQVQEDIIRAVPNDLVGLPSQVAIGRIANRTSKAAQQQLDTEINLKAAEVQDRINRGTQGYEEVLIELEEYGQMRQKAITKEANINFDKDIGSFSFKRKDVKDILPSGSFGSRVTTADRLKRGAEFGLYAVPGLGEGLLVASAQRRVGEALLMDDLSFGQRTGKIALAVGETGLAALPFKVRYGPRGSLAKEIAIGEAEYINKLGVIPRGTGPKSLINQRLNVNPEGTLAYGRGNVPGNKNIQIFQAISSGEKGEGKFILSIQRPKARIVDTKEGIFAERGTETLTFGGSGKIKSQFPVSADGKVLQRLGDVQYRELQRVERFGTERIGRSFPLSTTPFKKAEVGSLFKESSSGKTFVEVGSAIRQGRTSKSILEIDSFGFKGKPSKSQVPYLDKNLAEEVTIRGRQFLPQVRTIGIKVNPSTTRVGTKIGKSGRRSSTTYLQNLYQQQDLASLGQQSTSAIAKELVKSGLSTSSARNIAQIRGTKALQQFAGLRSSTRTAPSENIVTLSPGIRSTSLVASSPTRQRDSTRPLFVPLSTVGSGLRPRERAGSGSAQAPNLATAQANAPFTGNLLTFPGSPTTTTPRPRINPGERGKFRLVPLPVKINYSEGFRPFRLTSAKPSGFGYQPSFTALVQNIRGGSLPGKVKGGYNPFVLRSINPVKRKRGRPKGSRKRR